MRRISVCLFTLFLLLAPRLFSMDWPSLSGGITGNFGWNEGGLPRMGVSFEGEETFAAAEGGELIYRRREDDTASRLPSPLGSWAAVDHGDGIISIYSRFDDESSDGALSSGLPGRIEINSPLGRPGTSGWALQRGFYFQLFDRKERCWINPAMIITPPEDTRPPLISRVRLRDTQGRFLDASQTRNLSQGLYTVFVDAVDTVRNTGENPLAPYRIICSLNGSESGALGFETYSARDSVLVVYRNGLIPVRQVYAQGPGYEIADVWFTRGQSALEIIVQDIAGNVRNVVYRFAVQ